MKILYTASLCAVLATTQFALEANANPVTFEGFTLNTSVNGQGGWTVEDSFGNSVVSFDEAVVNDGTGNTVWRVSNSVTTGGFSNLPSTQTSPQVAGETGATLNNDYGSDHTMPNNPPGPGGTATTSNFSASLKFKSATDAAQSDLAISVSAAAKQSPWRDNAISIVDDGANGFDVFVYETGSQAAPFGAGASSIEIASDLSYDDWHTLEFFIEFADGLMPDTYGNDTIYVLIDGVLVHTGSTWESYYATGPSGITPPQAVDSVLFRISGTAQAGNAGNGFYFDDVYISNDAFQASAQVPEPASLAIWGLLGLGTSVVARRRRIA